MFKRLLTTAALVTLIGGAAVAQTMPGPTPDASAPPAPPAPSADPAAGGMAPAAPMTPPADAGAAPAPMAPMAPGAQMGGAADSTMTANAPSPAPTDYPVCKTRSQDRCVQKGMAMKSGKHTKSM